MKKGLYRHYKNKDYEVIEVARYSENHKQEFVVYKSLYEGEYPYGQVWIRPKEMFLENIEIDGKIVPRFEFIGK